MVIILDPVEVNVEATNNSVGVSAEINDVNMESSENNLVVEEIKNEIKCEFAFPVQPSQNTLLSLMNDVSIDTPTEWQALIYNFTEEKRENRDIPSWWATDHELLTNLLGWATDDHQHLTTEQVEKLDGIDLSSYMKTAIIITIAELEELRDSSLFLPEQRYRITDYQTHDYIRQSGNPVQRYTAPVEEILVQALNNNTLMEEGYSLSHPGEKIVYKQSRPAYVENPSISYSTEAGNYWTVVIEPDSDNMLVLTSPYDSDPDTEESFALNIIDNDTGVGFDFDFSNKWTYREFLEGKFHMITNSFLVLTETYINYNSDDGNTWDQTIEVASPTQLAAGTPSNDTTDWIYNDNWQYREIYDNDTGWYMYIDWRTKWDLRDISSWVFELLYPYSIWAWYTYYTPIDWDSWDYSFIIDSDLEFHIDISNNIHSSKADTYFDIVWNDSSSITLSYDNYGIDWIYTDWIGIKLLTTDKSLNTDLAYIEWYQYYCDSAIGINFEDNIWIYARVQNYVEKEILLTDNVEISGGWTYSILLGGLITWRKILSSNMEVPVNYYGTKFRRYSVVAPTRDGITTFAIDTVVRYWGQLFVALKNNLNKNPWSSPERAILSSKDNDTIKKYFLWFNSQTVQYVNVLDEWKILSVSLADWGAWYIPWSGVILTVAGGDWGATLSCTANGSWVITSIDSIVTTGYWYPRTTKAWSPTPASNVGTICQDGAGALVNITATSDWQHYVILHPDLSDHREFDFFQPWVSPNDCIWLKIEMTDGGDLDMVMTGWVVTNSNIKIKWWAMATLANVSSLNANIQWRATVFTLARWNIDYMENVITETLDCPKISSIIDACIFNMRWGSQVYIDGLIQGKWMIENCSGMLWRDVMINADFKNNQTVNIDKTSFQGIMSDSYFNSVWLCSFSFFSWNKNTIMGDLQRNYIGAFYKGVQVYSECRYLRVFGEVQNVKFNNLVWHETLAWNDSYPCVFAQISDSEFNAPVFKNYMYWVSLISVRTYWQTYNNMYPSKIGNCQIKTSVFYNGIINTDSPDNKTTMENITAYSYFANRHFPKTVNGEKKLTNWILYGNCNQNELIRWELKNVTCLWSFGNGNYANRNIFQKDSDWTLVDLAFFGDQFNKNRTTALLKWYTCWTFTYNNDFSQPLTDYTSIGTMQNCSYTVPNSRVTIWNGFNAITRWAVNDRIVDNPRRQSRGNSSSTFAEEWYNKDWTLIFKIRDDWHIGNTTAPLDDLHIVWIIRATTAYRIGTTLGASDANAGIPTAITVNGGIITAITKTTPVANWVYVMWLKLTPWGTDWSITITNWIITAITQAT